MASNLIVLSEDEEILPYLNKNGLYPNKLLFRTVDLMEELGFADSDMVVLVVIHSLTRFSSTEMAVLFGDLHSAADNGALIIIMSDVELKSADFVKTNIQFVHYQGDLFFGKYTGYVNNKPSWTIASEGLVVDTTDKHYEPKKREEFWSQFAEFTDKIETFVGEKPERREAAPTADSKYMDKLIDIDLFSGNSN